MNTQWVEIEDGLPDNGSEVLVDVLNDGEDRCYWHVIATLYDCDQFYYSGGSEFPIKRWCYYTPPTQEQAE